MADPLSVSGGWNRTVRVLFEETTRETSRGAPGSPVEVVEKKEVV